MSDSPGSGLPPMTFPPPPPPPPFPGGSGGGSSSYGRSGPPWEGDGSLVDRFVATARQLLTEPNAFFPQMRITGGLQNPIVYLVIGLLVAGVASTMYSFVVPGSMGGFGAMRLGVGSGAGSIIMVPLFGLVGSFIGAGIFHIVLSLLGGAKQPFEATYRVVAYVGGTTALFNLIPICGGLIGGIYGLYLYIIGLANVHETDTTKAAIAVLTPAVLCCVAVVIFGAALAAIIGATIAGAR